LILLGISRNSNGGAVTRSRGRLRSERLTGAIVLSLEEPHRLIPSVVRPGPLESAPVHDVFERPLRSLCESQRDWTRKETVPLFMNIAIETGSTFGIQLSYDLDKG
jgi:hypothetical protein